MAIGASKLSDMPKGAYWYMVPGKEPVFCEYEAFGVEDPRITHLEGTY